MPTYNAPKKNTEYIFYVGLRALANANFFQVNPTLATGDAKVSIDGGAFANLTTLPTVTPASGAAVKITLSASEMNGDNIVVMLSDAAGSEWGDLLVNIQTVTNQFNDLATSASIPTAAAIADAVLDDAIAEPSAVFAWGTATLRNIIGFLGALSRNKMTQTDTTSVLRNDADSADVATSTISDDGTTFTRGEWS